MPRALKNLDISLGLATIPLQLFTATSSQGVGFHLLHAKCGSRIQMRLECPIHGIVPREETVKGYERQPEHYEDECRKRLLKAIEQKIAGQDHSHSPRWRVGPQMPHILASFSQRA